MINVHSSRLARILTSFNRIQCLMHTLSSITADIQIIEPDMIMMFLDPSFNGMTSSFNKNLHTFTEMLKTPGGFKS